MPTRKNREASPKKFYSTRQQIAVKRLSRIVTSKKNQKNITIAKILKEAGYSDSYASRPSKVFKSKNFQQALDHYLPDDIITEIHGGVLKATRVDHMVFPLAIKDEDIIEIIESVAGCKVKKFQHSETQTHVWFWTPDNQSRMRAIAEAYRVKDKYPAEKHKVEEEIKIIKIINYGSKKG